MSYYIFGADGNGRLPLFRKYFLARQLSHGLYDSDMKTATAKIFSSFYALYSGIAFLSITAVFFAPLIHRLLHILHVEEDDEKEA